ncbi:hypothetical protein TRFO_25323 [Tritrichomonas foetus]|uniref:Calponin-homology (CH) domain-containing protein n=1 Tax=Tritrichomonas foetus TaxID=1144522 RepID=A0A1J4K6R3_9EUKA|nr:hypothetical protein TRFO_25323 [Tritrichomonas foetus]|eukprot:OHT06584.1 hypothetical protein TRFO_25323 [Tritrichomonas foetus]
MTTNKEIMIGCKLRLLKWISEASGERVTDWERVSRGDVICFILNRMRPGIIDLQNISDGVDKFARVGNWKAVSQAMRKLKMNWNYDQVKLVMADQPELEKLVLAIRRWETRFMIEPLEPPSPDEWNDNDIPSWFTQQTAKEIEERKLAMGESRTKHQSKKEEVLDIRKVSRANRKPLIDQIRGKF